MSLVDVQHVRVIRGDDVRKIVDVLVGPPHDPAENPVPHGQVGARHRTRRRQLHALREGPVEEMLRRLVGNVRVRQGEPEQEGPFMPPADIRVGLAGKKSRAVVAMLEPGCRVGRYPASRRWHVVSNRVGRGHPLFGLDPVHSLRRLRVRGVFLESVVGQPVLESVVLDLAPDVKEVVVLRFRETVVLAEQRELVPGLLPPPGRMRHAPGHGCAGSRCSRCGGDSAPSTWRRAPARKGDAASSHSRTGCRASPTARGRGS